MKDAELTRTQRDRPSVSSVEHIDAVEADSHAVAVGLRSAAEQHHQKDIYK